MATLQENEWRAAALKRMYNCVTAQAISESGHFLFAGNTFGDIFVQDIQELEKTLEPRARVRVFPQGQETEINSLAFNRGFLIVGTLGVLYGLKWDEENRELSSTRSWQIKIPVTTDVVETANVNCMWLRPQSDMLYAGCGDNAIYQISLEDGSIVRDYRGHSDYVHSVAGCEDGRIYSASEDGTVRAWCLQQKEAFATIEPDLRMELQRRELGNWIGAVAVNKEWLLCGGGPKLSLWHLPSMTCTYDFDFSGKVHVCEFIGDSILVGGEHNHVQFYALNGELEANIPIESTVIYSAAWQEQPVKFMSLAGFGNMLHILKDFRFLDSKIDLYKDATKPDATKLE